MMLEKVSWTNHSGQSCKKVTSVILLLPLLQSMLMVPSIETEKAKRRSSKQCKNNKMYPFINTWAIHSIKAKFYCFNSYKNFHIFEWWSYLESEWIISRWHKHVNKKSIIQFCHWHAGHKWSIFTYICNLIGNFDLYIALILCSNRKLIHA